MNILGSLRSLGLRLFRRATLDNELEEEVRSHIAYRADRLEQSGLSRAEAERRARIEFGGGERFKEECREALGGNWIDNLWQDVRFGCRMLRKSPGFTIVVVLTIALGVGATTAIFGLLDGIVLKPLSYPHPEQLVSVDVVPLALDASLRGLAPEDYFVFREQSRTFQDIGMYAETDTDRDVNVTGLAEPERVHALNLTPSVLSILGIPPVLGRIFLPADDSPGAPPTAILSYGYWLRDFNADASAVGKNIIVDGMSRQIIGVMPPTFRFLDTKDLALILPLQLDRNKTLLGNFSYFGIARLKPGITLAQANADVARMLPITLDSFPPRPGLSLDLLKQARLSPSLLALKQEVVGNIGAILWILMGSVGIVLLIACANVANLLLVRTESRQRELALRAALGATRRRIIVQLLRENVLIGLIGGILGLVLAYLAVRIVAAFPPLGLPRVSEISINSPVLCFAIAITLFTSLLFGFIPALKHGRANGPGTENMRVLGLTPERHRVRNVLVTVQITLAVVLLICAGLMIRTFCALTRVDPGFVGPAEIQTFRISIADSDVPDDASVARIEQQIQEKLASLPSISSVAFSSAVPLEEDARFDTVFAADRTYIAGAPPPLRHLVYVSPGYFKTLGIPLLAGRELTWADIHNRVPVALISENFAHEYWGTPMEALGKRVRIRTTDDWREIIGVVGDVRDASLDKPPRSNVYWPALVANMLGHPLHAQRSVTMVIRSPLAGSESLMKPVREAVWSIDANLPLAQVHTLNLFYTKSLAHTSFSLLMLAIAGAMALVLGTIGLYAVIAYSVSQRTQEIGIRIALGAQRRDVIGLFVREGMFLILTGLTIGLAGSTALTRFLSSLLYGVTATDPLTFGSVAVLLALVAAAACRIPVSRAVRMDPLAALRCQ